MAEDQQLPPDKSLEKLEAEITCPVCQDHFDEPKVLPCLHYYCKKCIKDLTLRSRPFPCPECREEIFLNENNPDKLPTAFFVNRMKELYIYMKKAHGKVEAPCEMCSQSKSVAFCRQCTYFICTECVKCHETMKVFVGHTVVLLEELKQGVESKVIPMKQPPTPTCSIHDGEPLKMYCYDCDSLICRDCIVIDHASHQYEFVKKAAAKTKSELVEKLAPLKEVKASLCKATDTVRATRKEVVEQCTKLADTIENSFTHLRDILEEQNRALVAEITSTKDEKTRPLDIQEKSLVTSANVVQSLIDLVEQNIDGSTDEELLTACKQISGRIANEMKKHQSDIVEYRPRDSSVEIDKEFDVVTRCDRLAAEVRLLFDDGSAVEINQPTKFSLHVPTPPSKAEKLRVELKSSADKSFLSRKKCVEKQANTYEVELTPRVRGRHQLAVSVNSEPVTGSPFPVFVKIPPTQLGKPVRIISNKELIQPWGVALNSSEEVLVADMQYVVVYDKQGTKLRSFKPSKQKYSEVLCGVAVDNNDNVYVTDTGNHCIYKFDKDGNQVGKVGASGNKKREFQYPRGVSVANDKLFVCDYGNNRIQVFTMSLEFVEEYGTKGSEDGQFVSVSDIAFDEEENAYVCDRGNNRVQVFTKDWSFLYAFNKKGSNAQLKTPNNICLFGQFVHVVESSVHCVSVFLRSGQFVASFGETGREAGKFNCPEGIACDDDGFVYVCDFVNKNILVF